MSKAPVETEPDLTPSAAMSLRALRADIVSRASGVAEQARKARRRGHLAQARQLRARAEALLEVARSVNVR